MEFLVELSYKLAAAAAILHLSLAFICSFARVSSLSEMAQEYGYNPVIVLLCVIPGACYLFAGLVMAFTTPTPQYFLLILAVTIGLPILSFFSTLGLWIFIALGIGAAAAVCFGGLLVPLLVLIAPGIAVALVVAAAGVVFVVLDSMIMFF